MHRFNHGRNTVDGVIGKTNHPFRARSHTYATAPAPGWIGLGRSLLIFIITSKWALFRTAFTIGTAFHVEFGIGLISRPGMNCLSPFHALDTLNGLHHGSGAIFPAGLQVHGCPDCACSIYTRAPGFIGKTYKMGVRKIIFNLWKAGPQPVLKLQIVGPIGYHSRGQNHHVRLNDHMLIQQ